MEMSLHEGGVSYSGPWLIDEQLGNNAQCLGNAHPEMSPHGVYRCLGEDEWIAVACETDADWEVLAGLLGLDTTWALEERRMPISRH